MEAEADRGPQGEAPKGTCVAIASWGWTDANWMTPSARVRVRVAMGRHANKPQERLPD